jgi:hypothetical protein
MAPALSIAVARLGPFAIGCLAAFVSGFWATLDTATSGPFGHHYFARALQAPRYGRRHRRDEARHVFS